MLNNTDPFVVEEVECPKYPKTLTGTSCDVSHCGDMGMVGKYSTSIYITFPHFGGLLRFRTTHIVAMMLEVILCQSFCVSVSNLVFGVNGEDLDESLVHMFAKMMIANVYVLGPWM